MSRWILLGIACAVIFADSVGYTIVIPVLPTFAQELSLGETWAGMLYASYGLISVLLYLPFGYLVDRWGERVWLAGGMLVLGGTSLAFALVSGFWPLLGCRMAQGVAASATWAAALPLAARLSSPERRGLEMSIVAMAFSVGVIAGPALGSIGEVRDPFIYFASLPFGLAVLAFFFIPAKRSDLESETVRQAVRPSHVELTRSLLCACLVILVTCTALGALEVLLPLQLTQIGWSRQHIGMLFSAWGVVTLVVHPVIGLWSDRRGRQEPMIFGLLLAALFVPTLFMFLESLWMFPLVFCTIIALTAALVPTLPLMADGLEEDQAGKAFGFYNVSFSIGIVLGPWLGGYVTEQINVVGAALFLVVPLVLMAYALPRFLAEGGRAVQAGVVREEY